MDSLQNLKKRLKSVANIKKITALDMSSAFAIMEMIKHTAFPCASGRRQF